MREIVAQRRMRTAECGVCFPDPFSPFSHHARTITTALIIGFMLSISIPSTGAYALQPRRSGQESFLKRAVFSDGRLWLLSDAGELSSIVDGQDTRIEAGLPQPALDICVRQGHLEAVTCAREKCNKWTIYRLKNGKWSKRQVVQAKDDDFFGMSCSADKIVLVTTKRLIEVSRLKQRAVQLSEKLDLGFTTTVYASFERVLVGLNRGEFGGNLLQIDRRNGKVRELMPGSRANAIAPMPWKPDCVAVAEGLIHFYPHGRILGVCSDQVQSIYSKEFVDTRVPPPGYKLAFKMEGTVAFFGIARVGNELWAAGMDGIYRLKAPGEADALPLPNFKEIGNIRVSFDLPDVILVLTDINSRKSVSGSVPLIVPR